MKILIEGTPEELLAKADDALLRVVETLPRTEMVSAVEAHLLKSKRRAHGIKERALRELHEEVTALYDDQLGKMLDEIDALLSGKVEKAQKFPAGSVRTWANGKRMQKQADGSWKEQAAPKQVAKEAGSVPFTVKLGDYSVTYTEIKDIEGGQIQLIREDGSNGPRMPRESLPHFINDMAGKVEGPPSDVPEIQYVLDGRAKFLGKGDDGLAFKVGDKVVKVSTTVPYQPDNPFHVTPKAAMAEMRKQSEIANTLHDKGVPGMLPIKHVEHGDKAYQIKEYVEIPEKLTRAQLDEVQASVRAMHEAGYALNDQIQVGIDSEKRVVHFDLGKAAPLRDHDRQADMDSLSRLYREHGEDYVPVGASADEEFMAATGDLLKLEKLSASPALAKIEAKRLKGLMEAMVAENPKDKTRFEWAYQSAVYDLGLAKSFPEEDVSKGEARGGKYIKRVPFIDSKGRKRYRYYYSTASLAREAKEGDEVKLGDARIRVEQVDADGTIHFHDGEKLRNVSPEKWTDLMVSHHGEKFLQAADKKARSTINAVYRLVPKEMLAELKGGTDAAKLEDLKRRVPDVYEKLSAAFKRTGVSPNEAKRFLSYTLRRRGWNEDARAHMVGSALEPGGQAVVKNYRQIVSGAENLAGGSRVEAKHVAASIELRSPGSSGEVFSQEVAKLAGSAEKELAALSRALASARDRAPGASAEVLAAALAAKAVAQLQMLNKAFPGLADKAMAPAREALLEVPSAAPRKAPTARGSEGVIYVTGEGGAPRALDMQYRLMEASEVVASHKPDSFRPHESYPEGVQERAYHRDQAEQDKVRRNAQKMNPAFLVNTDPTAINGPPVVTPDGVVLGGNSRAMSMQRAYSDHPESATKLKQYLTDHAHEMGLQPQDIAAMKSPVLVREVKSSGSKEELQLLVRQMNESFTQGMDPRTMQVALGRKLTDKSLKELAGSMSGDETLAAFLDTPRASGFIDGLFANGIIDQRNANQYMRKNSRKFNEDGKRLVERILVGRMVEDADTLSDTKASTVSSVARAVPYMMQAEGHGAGYSIRTEMRVALSAMNEISHLASEGVVKAPDSKTTPAELEGILDNLRTLPGMGEDHAILKDSKARKLLDVLVYKGGPRQMAGVFQEYAKIASNNPEGQQQLLGETMSPERVLDLAIERAGKRGQETKEAPKDEGQGGLFKSESGGWIAVDLDGTILEPLVGDDYEAMAPDALMPPLKEPLPGAVEGMEDLHARADRVSIYTARFENEAPARNEERARLIEQHLQRYGIPFDDIYVGVKPKADRFIDDRAIRFLTWDQVRLEF